MAYFSSVTSKKIGRNCHLLEFSAAGNFFSTGSGHASIEMIEADPPRTTAYRTTISKALYLVFIGALCTLGITIPSPAALGQLPPLQAPPKWGQVPQGTGACSVEKSCAELAPGMIQKALGPSPLGHQVHELAAILSSSRNGSAKDQAAAWAANAFRHAGADEVRVEKFTSPADLENVIAEIRGRQYPQEYVLLAAPLSSDSANALATAENAALLVEAVRVIQASGSIPRRSIRFVLFGTAAEIPGGRYAGVWAYTLGHRADLDRITAAVAMDAATGALDGFSLEDRPAMLPAVRVALEPLYPLGLRNFTEEVKISATVTPFWLEGVPTLVATSVGPEGGIQGSQTGAKSSRDDIDPANLQRLKRGVAAATVTAYALADAKSRIAPRRSRAAVQLSIDSGALEPKLKTAGLWKPWQASQASASR